MFFRSQGGRDPSAPPGCVPGWVHRWPVASFTKNKSPAAIIFCPKNWRWHSKIHMKIITADRKIIDGGDLFLVKLSSDQWPKNVQNAISPITSFLSKLEPWFKEQNVPYGLLNRIKSEIFTPSDHLRDQNKKVIFGWKWLLISRYTYL